MAEQDSPKDSSFCTSLKVFRKYFKRQPDGSIDASAIISRDCFDYWLETRRHGCSNPAVAFQRTLTCHLTASDGRKPFNPEEERAVLHVLRQKRAWPCFEGSTVEHGIYGFRSLGYHERRLQSSSASVISPRGSTLSNMTGDSSSTMYPVSDSRSSTPRSFATEADSPAMELLERKRLRMDFVSIEQPVHNMPRITFPPIEDQPLPFHGNDQLGLDIDMPLPSDPAILEDWSISFANTFLFSPAASISQDIHYFA